MSHVRHITECNSVYCGLASLCKDPRSSQYDPENTTPASARSDIGQFNVPVPSVSKSSRKEYHQQSAWLLAAAGAQTEQSAVSFNDVMDACTTYAQENTPCATNTIASILLLIESLLSH